MRWVYGVIAVGILGLGLFLLTMTGETMWVSKDRSGYPAMIYLCLLFLLFPMVMLIMPRRR